jgi:ATP-dependent DNA ligase
LPDWIRPQLTQLVQEAPDGPQWLHEIKYDGFRMHARLDRGEVRLLTRNGLDWTHKYPAIAGELCGWRLDGITSFSMIQMASDAGNAAGLVFFLFDLALPRRRGSQRPPLDRAQGTTRRLAVVHRIAVALQRSPDRVSPNSIRRHRDWNHATAETQHGA